MKFNDKHVVSFETSIELDKLIQKKFPFFKYKTMLFWARPGCIDEAGNKIEFDAMLVNKSDVQFNIQNENTKVYPAYIFTEIYEMLALIKLPEVVKRRIRRTYNARALQNVANAFVAELKKLKNID